MSNDYSIGVDLGGTNLRVAAYSGETGFLDSIALPTRLSAGRDEVVRDMSEAVKTLAGRRHGDRKLTGIAVGTPGPLELPAGILRKPPNLPGWNDFNLKDAITLALGLWVNGKKVAEGSLDHSVSGSFSLSETFDVGVDNGTPVSNNYTQKDHFPFSGKIDKVTISIKAPDTNLVKEATEIEIVD
jgi:ROK family